MSVPLVPIRDQDIITMYYNSNTTTVSGVSNPGVYGIYYVINSDIASDDFLSLSSKNVRQFKIQSLNWGGSSNSKKYTFTNSGAPLVTGNYISFETTVGTLTEYLQSGSQIENVGGNVGSAFINVQDLSPTDDIDGDAEFRVWNITTTTPAADTGLFKGSLNTASSNSAARTFVAPTGLTLYYGQLYYIQNVGKAVDKNALNYWNQQNNSGIGLNTVGSGSGTVPIIFLNSSGLIPPSTTPVFPGAPPPPPKAQTTLEKLEHEALKWILIIVGGLIVVGIIAVVGVILLVTVLPQILKVF